MTTAPLLQAQDLGCRRGGRWLFKGLSLTLGVGGCLHLRGANGAGKTSLMRVLCGLARADAGTVARAEPPLFIGHHNAHAEELTLAENLAFNAALAGHAAGEADVQTALTQAGVASHAHQPVRRLSQGQRRRGALARLVLPHAPRLWLLDEPHNTLDVAGIAWLDGVIGAHRARGGAVLLTGHASLALPSMQSLDLE